ncbi:transposase [Methylocella tundrae]|uniref:Transposase n=1 Tax=Methylocella tundrae TaxID=227605 RepID=A0A8B6LZY3_METTU|nr:IS1595 family transposase [Methylocella tundrae]VTZ25596.1 transposase [Methylocella tundrae]VTZ48327.1 transposase [Methylocella tundrae]
MPKPVHQMSVAEFEKMFPNEDACCAYLVARRWPDGVRCPRCGAENPHKNPSRPWSWQCYQCAPETSYRFSHLAGTIFENTNKPLREWFRVIHLMLTSKKGMSALQIMRYMGFGSYKTAWEMCHKVRTALIEDVIKLGGIVEVDETFVGGLAKNKHIDKRGKGGGTGGIGSGKTPIVGAVKRKGNVIARVVSNVTAATLEAFVNEAVSNKVSLLCTDQWAGYRKLGKEYPHGIVDHSRGQYVIGSIHTQKIEGFWSIFKRGIVGSFYKVSRKYMHLYVAEFQFRYNNRHNPDIFGEAIGEC